MLEGSHEAPELVPNGLGAQMGLEPLQHVVWAEKVEHPASHIPDKVTSELLGALKLERCVSWQMLRFSGGCASISS